MRAVGSENLNQEHNWTDRAQLGRYQACLPLRLHFFATCSLINTAEGGASQATYHGKLGLHVQVILPSDEPHTLDQVRLGDGRDGG